VGSHTSPLLGAARRIGPLASDPATDAPIGTAPRAAARDEPAAGPLMHRWLVRVTVEAEPPVMHDLLHDLAFLRPSRVPTGSESTHVVVVEISAANAVAAVTYARMRLNLALPPHTFTCALN
jgi:hypothetical protein